MKSKRPTVDKREGEAGHNAQLEGKMGDRTRSQTISTRLQRIAQQASRERGLVFTRLAHHMDVDMLREAHRRLRKDAAPGVDGVTAEEYAVGLVGQPHGQRGFARRHLHDGQVLPQRAVVAESVEFGEGSPFPDTLEELLANVYA